MRTTIRLEDDLDRDLRSVAAVEGISFGKLVNHLLRLGLQARTKGAKSGRRFKEKSARLGAPHQDLTKALDLAGQLEDEETLRKLALRK